MTTSAPPPRDPGLAADPATGKPRPRTGTAVSRTTTPGQQAEVDQESLYLAAQADRDAELDARQMDAQHQDALAENQARGRAAEATEPEASL